MSLDIYYIYIYLAIVSIVTIAHLNNVGINQRRKKNKVGAFVLTIILAIFIGLRPNSYVFGDTPNYIDALRRGAFIGEPITWDSNYIFQPMMAYLSLIGASPRTLLMILSIINFGFTYVAMRKMFPEDTMLAMLVFFGAFCTFGGAVNGLKAGCASALFLVAIAYRKKKIVSILFLIFSMGFHHSMQLPIIAYLLCLFFKNTKVYFGIWFVCLILAIAHVTSLMDVFASYTDEKGADYLLRQAGSMDSSFGGKIGFRYDFVLYSIVPIVLGYITLFRKKLISKEYSFMINYYLITNAIWMLCMYAQYTNRIAGLSWLMYPMLMIYPFLKLKWGNNRSRILCLVVMGHLGFTLAMNLIYY